MHFFGIKKKITKRRRRERERVEGEEATCDCGDWRGSETEVNEVFQLWLIRQLHLLASKLCVVDRAFSNTTTAPSSLVFCPLESLSRSQYVRHFSNLFRSSFFFF